MGRVQVKTIDPRSGLGLLLKELLTAMPGADAERIVVDLSMAGKYTVCIYSPVGYRGSQIKTWEGRGNILG